jgi:hypothetical protein
MCQFSEDERYFDANIKIKDKSEIFKEVEEILIEQNEESIVSYPFDFLVLDNSIIISSWNNKIKVFEKNGKYRNSIGSIGKGPGEYKEINSLIRMTENEFGVFDLTNRKIIVYTINSKLKYEINVNKFKINNTRSIINIGPYFYIHAYIEKEPPYTISVIDSSGSLIKYLVKTEKKYSTYAAFGYFAGGIQASRDKINIYEMNNFHNNYISVINLNNDAITKIFVNKFNGIQKLKDLKSYSLATVEKNISEHDNIIDFGIIMDRYVHVIFFKNNNFENYLYDMKKMKVVKVDGIIDIGSINNDTIYELKFTNNANINKQLIMKGYKIINYGR